ncbi:glycoside hydrolase family 36 protein [Salinibacterium sp. TMP30]|uniref:glycoside hydrolase family 36 protein n=1 Tax=Salinibacterium sp. TMP30 TaxID=3138237 RepID=UPI00313908BA
MSTERCAKFATIAEIPIDVRTARVYEFGWQSWTPSTAYSINDLSFRASTPARAVSGYRANRPKPLAGFQGDGLLAIETDDSGPVTVFGAIDGRTEVPTIRATVQDNNIVVESDGAVEIQNFSGGFGNSLPSFAESYLERTERPKLREIPSIWASWYQYFTRLTQADVHENLDAMDDLDLDVGVVRLDDAFQAGIGDWLETSSEFGSLESLVGSVLDRNRIAGLWIAPLIVGAHSRIFEQHPEWTVRNPDGSPVVALHNWGQDCYALDTTHPGAQDYLARVFTAWHSYGAQYFMVDFMFAGALPGIRYDQEINPITAYREAVQRIRSNIGSSYLQGCGAPMFPSIGLFDTMRVAPDVDLTWAAAGNDLSRPGLRSAAVSTAGRAFTHGRFWVNDPDCFMVRPGIERRDDWANIVEKFSGVRISSDRLRDLDRWGLNRTRSLLQPATPTTLGNDDLFSHYP